MRIETRFAWIIASCFLFGVATAGYISYRLESQQAREEVKQKADMLLEVATSVRSYTVDEVAPLLQAMDASTFHASQVPSFAAQSTIKRLGARYPEYRYRETALNPSNLHDRANDWEVGLLRTFRTDSARKEVSGTVGEGGDRRFYVARPIRVGSGACLRCHSTPEAAPRAMLAKYGPNNGFGWRMGEAVAIQLVEVPTAAAEQRAWRSVLVTVGSLSCVFVLSAAVFLMLLRRHVTHPLEALTRAAHATSVAPRSGPSGDGGGDDAEAVSPAPGGQFRDLHDAIVRLKTSVDRALTLMERQPPGASSGGSNGHDGPR